MTSPTSIRGVAMNDHPADKTIGAISFLGITVAPEMVLFAATSRVPCPPGSSLRFYEATTGHSPVGLADS